jgi:acyl-CoA reductase-like NAD-dependent aldehyde dehydrogenase
VLHKTGRLPEVQRIEVLQKLADLVGAEHEDFSRLIANEGGKPVIPYFQKPHSETYQAF